MSTDKPSSIDISQVTIPVPYVITVIALMLGGLLWITTAISGVSHEVQSLREEIAEERVTKEDFRGLEKRVRSLERGRQ